MTFRLPTALREKDDARCIAALRKYFHGTRGHEPFMGRHFDTWGTGANEDTLERHPSSSAGCSGTSDGSPATPTPRPLQPEPAAARASCSDAYL
jgi:hypothetical protein